MHALVLAMPTEDDLKAARSVLRQWKDDCEERERSGTAEELRDLIASAIRAPRTEREA